jgi:hypothetical protein
MPQFSLSGLVQREITIGNATIKVDGIVEAQATNSRTVTQHPVEQGYNISDAQHQLPVMVTLRAWITNHAQSAIDRRGYMSLPNATGLQLIESHVQNQLAKLENEANNGGLVTVRTKNFLYQNYYCLAFDFTENDDNGIFITMAIMERQDTSTERATAKFKIDTIGLWS